MLEPSRRDVLRLALGLSVLGVGVGGAGCTVSPAMENPASPSGRPGAGSGASIGPSPRPGAPPSVPAAALAEQQLSAYAAAILSGPHRNDLDQPTRTLLGFVRDAHARHAVALAGDDLTARPTTASPSPTATPPTIGALTLSASLKALSGAETKQSRSQRRAAAASSGLDALLSGSLAVAASSFAAALVAEDPPAVAALEPPVPAALLTDVAATQAMVSQLHAIVYGYQAAIGRLKVGSTTRARAVTGLAARRALLDELIAALIRRSADVPAAEPAYVPSPYPTSVSTATALVRAMETRLVPYAGLMLAAAGNTTDRARALDLLVQTEQTARSWGAPLQAWPGWSD